MKETTKTSVFLGLAVLLLILAVALRPHTVEIRSEETVGQALFPKFTDAFSIKGLEIVRPLPDGGTGRFRIAERDGVWTIPSHDGYPADAKDRMPGIAEALIDLTVVAIAEPQSDDAAADRILYGVIDPTSEEVTLGEGIGMRVTVTGPNDQTLVDMILGKEVADSENKAEPPPFGADESAKLRYVRIPGEQTVYIVALDAERFSTRFEDWIEKNLLDISTLDIRSLYIDEYTVETEFRMVQNRAVPQMIPNFIGDITLDYDGSAAGKEKWSLRRLMSHRGPRLDYVEDQMKPGEELNVETLDEALAALNDLKIIDVAQKPATLAEALRTGEGLDSATDLDMLDRGFAVVEMPDPKNKLEKKTTILSKNGDFQITMRDGLHYVLRFGDAAGVGTEEGSKDAGGDDKATDAESAAPGLNRTMMITAEFDESSVPRPEPETLLDVPVVGAAKPGAEDAATYTDEDVKAVEQRNAEIEKRNQRALDAYETTLENGRKRAEALNARFAPWYYVISESVYRKIHLDRKNVFRSIDISAAKRDGSGGHVGHDHGPDDCDDPDCPDHALPGQITGTSGFGTDALPPSPRWPTLPLLDDTSLMPSLLPDWAILPAETPETPAPETPTSETQAEPEPVQADEPQPEVAE